MRGRSREDDAGSSGSGKRRKGPDDPGLQEANGSGSGRKKRGSIQQGDENGQQASKKAKSFVRGGDGYCPGNIVEIELHNFMTYKHLQAQPGPRLNLITGPNGSGKSTIVCSICIGLGGNPKVLGRQKDIGDFVKRGEQQGSVRLKLRGDTEDHKIDITRKIFKDNKSEWFLDGRTCKKEDIANVVEKYNCQIDNLTQFLPQDKVCEFARLTSIELLLETEKAVGDPALPAMHSQLIQAMKVISELTNKVKSQTETLAVLEKENADLAIDVARINQRNQLLDRASFMKLKLPWIEYDTVQKTYMRYKNEFKDLKEEAQRAKEEYLAAAAPLEEAKARLKKTDGKSKQEHEKLKNLERKQRESMDAEDKASRDMSDVILKKNNAVNKANKLEKDIEKATGEVENAETELQSIVIEEIPVDTEGEYAAKMEGLRNTISGFLAEKETLEQKLPKVMNEMQRCHHKLNAAKDSRYHVEQALMRGSSKLKSALDTVEQYRATNAFKGNVYGPIAAEVKVLKDEHTKFVEGAVGYRIWTAFVTTNMDDHHLLRNLGVMTVNVPETSNHRAPAHVSEELRALGVTHRLDETFEAPPAVMSALYAQAGVQHHYIGTDVAADNCDGVSKYISNLWTPHTSFKWSKSAYGGYTSASTKGVKPAAVLKPAGSSEDTGGLKERATRLGEEAFRLEQRVKQVGKDIETKDGEMMALEKEKAEQNSCYHNQHRRQNDAKKKVDTSKKVLAMREKERNKLPNPDIHQRELARLHRTRMDACMQHHRVAMSVGEILISFSIHSLEKAEATQRMLEMEAAVSDVSGRHTAMNQRVTQGEVQLAAVREALKKAKGEAEKSIKLDNDVQERFQKLPATAEDLEEAIEAAEAEADAIMCDNEDVVDHFHVRQEKIKELLDTLEEENGDLEQQKSDVDKIKGEWLPRLRSLVGEINETFGRNFAEMAVAGEVLLDEREEEFDKYGIQIKVKFRADAPLQVLSAQHQSGGERSVSTILFLVSLQAITHCPFRVVDEINQGMDPNNERKMFGQLVRAASQPNTPQCFLLTPKLLPDLDYGASCTIINIMNGPYVKIAANGAFKQGSGIAETMRSIAAVG